MMIRILVLSFLFTLVTSCGSIERSAVGLSSGVIGDASYELETESNWESFRRSVPANLKMIEGLLFVDKDNKEFMATLAKGYGAYSFVVYDTLFLEDVLSENDSQINRDQALLNYRRSVEYGIKFLEENNIIYDQLIKLSGSREKLFKLLDSEIGSKKKDIDAVFFTGLSFMNMVNLNKTNYKLIGQLPVAKGLIDWACSKIPAIGGNNCKVIEAIYMTSRPRTFGGEPEKGRALFEQFIKDNPDHWFARLAYVQYYLIPNMDDIEYRKQKIFLDRAKKAYHERVNWTPLEKNESREFADKQQRIYQALAIRRFEIIEKFEKDIF